MANYDSFKKVTSAAIVDGAVTTGDAGGSSFTGSKFQDNTIGNDAFADGSISSDKLAASLDISGMTVTYRSLVNGDFANSSIVGSKMESNAVINALGYTPLNKAGDTTTGQLVVSNTDIIGSGTNNDGFRTNNQNFQLVENNTVRYDLNSSGQATHSRKPVWQASGRGGWRYANSYGGPSSWRELDDMGWNFATGGGVTTSNNCRVTVPVAGYYHTYLQTYWYNDANSTNGYTHFNIALNGGNSQMYGGRTPHTMFAYGLRNNHAPGIMVGFIRYMNAGQYVTPRPYFGGNQGRHHGDHSHWSGFLIG
jgi:hypothetical protein